MNWKPKPWIALVLNVFMSPLGLVYAGKPGWAGALLAATWAVAAAAYLHLFAERLDWIAPALQIAVFIGGLALAYLMAKSAQATIRRWYMRWYGLAGIAVGFMLAVMVLRVFFYEPFRIPSTSMNPGMPKGANIIVQKFGYGHFSTFGFRLGSSPISAPLDRGDPIVFEYPADPSQDYVMRIVGLPGDRVVYRGKHVIVNGIDSQLHPAGDYIHSDTGRALLRFHNKLGSTEFDTLQDSERPPLAAESSAFPFRDQCVYGADEFSCHVPAGHYFVMGDNRDNSNDSRYWGFVRASQVVGKVVKIIL